MASRRLGPLAEPEDLLEDERVPTLLRQAAHGAAERDESLARIELRLRRFGRQLMDLRERKVLFLRVELVAGPGDGVEREIRSRAQQEGARVAYGRLARGFIGAHERFLEYLVHVAPVDDAPENREQPATWGPVVWHATLSTFSPAPVLRRI